MAETPETPKKVWKPDFLEALRETATVTEACRVAGIGRATAYRARQQDEAFAVAWADVEEESTEKLESVAVQRAKDGSDTLMIFLLKSRRPQKYRENVKIEHGGEIRTDLDELSRDQLRERARALLGE
jgi:hypothetical protein